MHVYRWVAISSLGTSGGVPGFCVEEQRLENLAEGECCSEKTHFQGRKWARAESRLKSSSTHAVTHTGLSCPVAGPLVTICVVQAFWLTYIVLAFLGTLYYV